MDNTTPRKSKALLITIIVVLLILVIGYLFYTQPAAIFGTKSANNTNGSIFAPLLGTSKKKDLATIDKQGSVTTTTTDSKGQNTTDGKNGGFGVVNGSGSGALGADDNGLGNTGAVGYGDTGLSPSLNPIPTPGIDPNTTNNNWNINGAGGGTPTDSTDGTINPTNGIFCQDGKGKTILCDPNSSPNTTGGVVATICPEDDPLTFTPTEQADIDKLVRQYYLISSGIKNEEEVALVLNDTHEQNTLLTQVNELIGDCKAQTANPHYTGPKIRKNNPFYSDPNNTTQTYLPGETVIWQGTQPASSNTSTGFGIGGISISKYNSPFLTPPPTYTVYELLSDIW